MMNNKWIMVIVVLIVGYLIGARFPQLARQIGM